MVVAMLVLLACWSAVDSEFIHYRDQGYYKWHSEKVNWADARACCDEEGAHLVVINSEDEHKLVKEMTNGRNATDIFVGFHDLFHVDEYHTQLGGRLDKSGYVQWADSYPKSNIGNIPKEDCGAFRLDQTGENGNIKGGIFNENCATALPFICEKTEKSECQPKFELEIQNVTWRTAHWFCENRGGRLAIPRSDHDVAELDEMFEKLNPSPNYYSAHIGFHSLFKESEFVDLTGYQVTFSKWAPGQPDRPDGERCGSMRQNGHRLNDIGCDTALLPFVCEYNCN